MADYDLKSITPSATVTDGTTIVFGAEGQTATPQPYTTAAIKAWIKSWIAKADVGLGNVTNAAQFAISNNLSEGTPATMRTNLAINGNIAFRHSGHVATRWYRPQELSPVLGASVPQNTINLFPFMAPQSITVSDLAARVATAQAAKNIQLAIYASNDTTCRPTGTALSSTASISVAATGDISATLGANVSLTRGSVYWLASNTDGTTLVMAAVGPLSTFIGGLIGSTSLSDIWNGGQGGGIVGLTAAQTFGTWPDLTSGSFTVISNAANIPAIAFKVASVP